MAVENSSGMPGVTGKRLGIAQVDYLANSAIDEAFGYELFGVQVKDTVPVAYVPSEVIDALMIDAAASSPLKVNDLELIAVDEEGLRERIRTVLGQAIAWGYVAGRLDQVSDNQGGNTERFVRARHLPRVVREALGIDASLDLFSFGDEAEIVKTIEAQRNVANVQNIEN